MRAWRLGGRWAGATAEAEVRSSRSTMPSEKTSEAPVYSPGARGVGRESAQVRRCHDAKALSPLFRYK